MVLSCAGVRRILPPSIQTGDKTVSDMAYIDFDTGDSRDGGKTDSEGGHFCSHVLIKKVADAVGRHLILLEKVPGVNFTTLGAHMNWVLAMPASRKTVDEDGTEKEYRAISDLVGFQSKTVQEAMTTGTVMDLQFVGHEVQEGGVDEDPLIRETLSEVKWSVKRSLDANNARTLLRRGIDYIRGWDAVEQESKQLLVRIKSEDGQIRTVPISPESEEADAAANEALQSAVVLNEFMNGFEVPLTQRHNGIRPDILQKMRAIGNKN